MNMNCNDNTGSIFLQKNIRSLIPHPHPHKTFRKNYSIPWVAHERVHGNNGSGEGVHHRFAEKDKTTQFCKPKFNMNTFFWVHWHALAYKTVQITLIPHQSPAPPFDAFTHMHEGKHKTYRLWNCLQYIDIDILLSNNQNKPATRPKSTVSHVSVASEK